MLQNNKLGNKSADLTVSCDAANKWASKVKIAKKLSNACDFKIATARLRSATSEELGKQVAQQGT